MTIATVAKWSVVDSKAGRIVLLLGFTNAVNIRPCQFPGTRVLSRIRQWLCAYLCPL
jgi:hypothetical protein